MAPPKRIAFLPIVTLVVGVMFAVVSLPQEYRSWLPGFLGSAKFHYGLDLAGGTQLDFRISEQEMEKQISSINDEIKALKASGGSADRILQLEAQLSAIATQRANLTESIRTVLERRMNSLGVSEAVITPSQVGTEKHLLVECPGVVDIQKCIATVGKTIQLEFKEEFTDATPEFTAKVQADAEASFRKLTASGISLAQLGQDLGSDLGVVYRDQLPLFQDQLPKGLESLWNAQPGPARKMEGSITMLQETAEGGTEQVEVPGIFLVEVTGARTATGRTINEAPAAFKLLASEEEGLAYAEHVATKLDDTVPAPVVNTLRAMKQAELKEVELDENSAAIVFQRSFTPGQESMEASHILVAFSGALKAEQTVTRTKEEAKALADSLSERLKNGENFVDLAKEFSDGPSAETAGSLGSFVRGQMVAPFEKAAFALKEGELSAPVESEFGYHIIRSDKAPVKQLDTASYDQLTVTGSGAVARAQGLIARLQSGKVKRQEEQVHLRSLFFSLQPSGWKDTPLNGTHFRSANVTLDPGTNFPVVQISFDDEGGRLFEKLTSENIGKRIAIFVGGQLISAPTVQNAITGGTAVITGSRNFEEAKTLATDLNTGAIPAPIFLAGQHTVEATLGQEALYSSLRAALYGGIVLVVFMLAMYRVAGLIACVSLVLNTLVFLVFMKLPLFLFTSQQIVLTLAGIAGIILSMGIAVDANVLFFERMKEELRKGKHVKTAVRLGFEFAWSSIRDSNVSTLITSAILFIIGTSIVRGFAITLSIGVFLSLLIARYVCLPLMLALADTKLVSNKWVLPR